MKYRNLLASLLAVLSLGSTPALHAERSFGGSEMSVLAGSLVLLVPLLVVDASGAVIVTSVRTVGEGVVVVFKGASDAVTTSVKFSGRAAQGLSLTVGASVQVVATSTGQVLIASGKAIGFIPNEIGKSLLYHAPVADRVQT